MGVKNNFSQAVSELIGISRAVEPEQNKMPLNEERAEESMQMEGQASADSLNGERAVSQGAGVIEQGAGVIENETGQITDQKEPDAPQAAPNPTKERIMALLAQQQAAQQQQSSAQQEPEQQAAQQEPEQQPSIQQQTQQPTVQQQPSIQQPKPAPGLTTIARGTVIIGEINAEGDIELLGSVKGKIASQGDIKANGRVVGDLIGKDIELVACAVQGNITASGLVTVDEDSVVIGDVKGENFCLDGKIKGNVSVGNEARFQPKAILAGNVTTASIAMSQGAKIQGEVNIPLSEKETDMSFDVDMII